MKKLLTLVVTLMLLAPCAARAETVVTSFFPIYLFALNLCEGIDGLDVYSLTEPNTGCLHDYQLTTADMKMLSRADVFLLNGAGMESYLDFVFDAFPDLVMVDASEGVTLLCSEEHEHDGHEAHEHEGHDGHDHGESNAHIWLDPANARQMVRNLACGLAARCPAYAAQLMNNCERYEARLEALDSELRAGLAGLKRRDIITFHEAFPYFANAYGLHVAAVMTYEPEDTLSPRTLIRLIREVEELGRPPLFIEPQYENIAARTVARESGASIWTLDPVVTSPGGDVPLDWYETCMRSNMRVLQEALGE